MNLRKFNEHGLTVMHGILDAASSGQSQFTDVLLQDPSLTETLSTAVAVERPSFPRRLEMAAYCHSLLQSAGLQEPERDKGLWAWLAAVWFDQLAPARGDGSRAPGERARWIPALDESRRYYRHLVLGPYMIFRRHVDVPERAMVLLVQGPSKPGDVVEQIASRPDLVNCIAAVGAATALYCDADGKLKRGAGGKKPGSARRLGDVLMQFDLTFDLQSMSPEQLLDVLPNEFRRWQAPSGTDQPDKSTTSQPPRRHRGFLERLQKLVAP